LQRGHVVCVERPPDAEAFTPPGISAVPRYERAWHLNWRTWGHRKVGPGKAISTSRAGLAEHKEEMTVGKCPFATLVQALFTVYIMASFLSIRHPIKGPYARTGPLMSDCRSLAL
jgi:hypothetical protein